ncbi:uncharacterized protein LTR77_006884 [Saxophila tyrrhenica]|uniref:Trafficking protein particle complex subunit 11 n=1 Tax=Saxophila tyrrhenica TaxID=1690608 RepID=A0AAV9P9H3_9PEZI|nr:hypothetical protein LTR77_006884 [Saxophila tyrrhenica]
MEPYPSEYIDHNLPLVIVSGLGEHEGSAPGTVHSQLENGVKFNTQSPECSGERAKSLLHQFRQIDGSSLPWNASSLPGPTGTMRYRIRPIERSYTFPPRKAAPLPQSPSTEGLPPQHTAPSRTELHSPLSPLSPGSPIFPDGVFTPLWVAKHQYQVPSLFLACFSIKAESPDADEQMKTDINAIRTAISRSGFKSRLAVILLSDKSILNAPQLDERLSSVRRLTSLDSKTGLFFMPPMSSQGEIATFVHSTMTTLQPLCVEYYRDLTKHARRKKPKAGSSSMQGSAAFGTGAQSLSPAGWSIRYEVKQGVFAEIRQEMDVAERHYATAIDELFGTDTIFETTPPTSPRWNEARLLCDSLALRVLRCQLWSAQTTAAVQSWRNYKLRVADLLVRRGQGVQTYGWHAWDSRWAEIMAELVQRARLQSLQLPTSKDLEESAEVIRSQTYAPPEKAFASADRLPPYYSLHHAGYWLRLAIREARLRWKQALAIPSEDRQSPDQLPASAIASRNAKYDMYLVKDPHKEYESANATAAPPDGSSGHLDNLQRLTGMANEQFLERSQARMSDMIELEVARDLLDAGKHEEALQILLSLWDESGWRQEDWRDLFADLLCALQQCAHHLDDREIIVTSTYELMSIPAADTSTVKLDLDTCLEGEDSGDTAAAEPLSLKFHDQQRLSPLSLSFAFANSEAHVGEALECQLAARSHAHPDSSPLPLSSIKLDIAPGKEITIKHVAEDADSSEDFVDLNRYFESNKDAIEVEANLLVNPGQHRTFGFQLVFREAGPHQLRQASVKIEVSQFSIEHSFSESLLPANQLFMRAADGSLERTIVPHVDALAVTVLPKPPKVKLQVVRIAKEYYIDETVRVALELKNEEAEAIEGKILATLPAESEETLPLQWNDDNGAGSAKGDWSDASEAAVTHTIDSMAVAASRNIVLLAKAPPSPLSTEVTVELEYTLASDHQTRLRKSLTVDINIVLPFEAKFSFGPLLYPDPWPGYFDPDLGSEKEASGIPQSWRLSSHIRSLASSKLSIREAKPVIDTVFGDSAADVVNPKSIETTLLGPGQAEQFSTEIATRKHSLDDRRPTSLESTLVVTWSREGHEGNLVTTHLPVPRLTLPVSEPRVLCTVINADPNDSYDAILQYHIENPSTHFLTFAVTMEATEEFAFSGPKYRTLSLAPLSRYKVVYRIALQEQEDSRPSSADTDGEGRWILPALEVIDSYYQKTLRIHPGGPGVRLDEKQNIEVWVRIS